MATQEIAAMLDELMGRNRNSGPDDKVALEIGFLGCPSFSLVKRKPKKYMSLVSLNYLTRIVPKIAKPIS